MNKPEELAEKVFQPGNLIFGCNFGNFQSLARNGIRTPRAIGRYSFTPDKICLALMSNLPLPNRYDRACHYAPGGIIGSRDLGIIVSRERLKGSLPGQISAVGEIFWDAKHSFLRTCYDYNEHTKTVYGLPIKKEFSDEVPFCDEVRISAHGAKHAIVAPETWEGLIVGEHKYPTLLELIRGSKLERIPIFSSECNLLREGCQTTNLQLLLQLFFKVIHPRD